jgi:Rrf2 family transcriptional regulator, cysteine metabolism repressor
VKLSTKGRYAARAMLDLALHADDGPVLIKDISEREDISELYLKQLLVPLRVAGLVRTIRGAHGGFMLARPPSQIKLIEIVQSVEGSTAPVECVDDTRVCRRSDLCVTRGVWAEMKKAIDKVLESITLQDLVERQKGKEEAMAGAYQI